MSSAEFRLLKLCGSLGCGVIIGTVSRLRRLVLSDRFFFVTCRLFHNRRTLSETELKCLAQTISARRKAHGFLVTAWILLPDHWHAILYPHHPLTISEVMQSIKVSSTRRMNRARGELGLLWQGRFFDRAVRTAKEYHETMAYIHLNPVKAGLVSRPEDWPWSSAYEYPVVPQAQSQPNPPCSSIGWSCLWIHGRESKAATRLVPPDLTHWRERIAESPRDCARSQHVTQRSLALSRCNEACHPQRDR